jgi:hypothetical protein
MEEASWLRDIFFYMGSAILILVYGYIGKVNFWMAIGFCSLVNREAVRIFLLCL